MSGKLRWSDAPGGYWVKFDYDPTLVAELKRLIHYRDRKWDG